MHGRDFGFSAWRSWVLGIALVSGPGLPLCASRAGLLEISSLSTSTVLAVSDVTARRARHRRGGSLADPNS